MHALFLQLVLQTIINDKLLVDHQIFIVFKCLHTLPLALSKHQSLLSLSNVVQESPLHP